MADKPALDSNPRLVVLPVDGMHGTSCVDKLEKVLSAIAAVRSVSVDLPSRTVSISYADAPGVELRIFRRAIEREGYDVLGESRNRQDAEIISLLAQKREESGLLRRLELGLILSIPLLAAEPLGLSPYTTLIFAIPLQIWAGWHFHRGMAKSLLRQSADLNTLVSLSTWAAFLLSAYAVFFPETLPLEACHTQWSLLAVVLNLTTLGRWLEAKARTKTSDSILRLMRRAPKTARVVRGGQEATVPIDEVEVGEIIRVRPGEQVGFDGIVVSGTSTLDESLLTGESRPMEKSETSSVWGGTINKTGFIEIKVGKAGGNSALSQIIAAARESQATKPRIAKTVDRAAAVFLPVAVISAVASAILWALYGPEPKALLSLLALASIFAAACPCALGLATPLAVGLGMRRSAKLGVLIRDSDVIEKLSKIDAILFDKTGTLTEGRPKVLEVIVSKKGARADLLSYALAAEQRSGHPFAKAVLSYARQENIFPVEVESFEAFPGRGVAIKTQGKMVRVGSMAWLKDEGCPPPLSLPMEGPVSLLGISVDEDFWGAFVLADEMRPSAPEAIRLLKKMGLEVILISGDRNEAAYRAAEEAGIGRVFAEVLPQEKSKIIERLQADGKKVALVGEGFHDAEALSRADLGIAISSGADIPVEAADMILLNLDLTNLAAALKLSLKIRKVIWENMFWAFGFNVLLFALAAGVLYPRFRLLMYPAFVNAAMALECLAIFINSLRLYKNEVNS